MPLHAPSAILTAAAAALLWSASAQAGTDPTGIWFDHNGRGAVEIKTCANGTGLCGHVVNIKDPANASRCGLQILGEVTPGGGGWIYSPERKRRYDVALTRLSDDKLRVVGNAGSRFFSRTFTWNRAPDDIVRCGETMAAAPAKEAQPEAKTTSTSAAPTAAVATTGAASGSAALVATAPVKRSAEPAAKQADVKKPAPVASDTSVTGATSATGTTKTAAVTGTDAGPADSASDAGSKRKCKYRIPYVGRTVSVPCRN